MPRPGIRDITLGGGAARFRALFRLTAIVTYAQMPDTLSSQQRTQLMSRVQGRDTKPEWILRSALHGLGYRYRVNQRALPGSPDIVFPRHRTAIFVHGCFWHRHAGCADASTPQTNTAFWNSKFADTVERDRRAVRQLEEQGWKVLTVWECQLTKATVAAIEMVLRHLETVAGPPLAPRSVISRRKLLVVAERHVQYRIRRQQGGANPVVPPARTSQSRPGV